MTPQPTAQLCLRILFLPESITISLTRAAARDTQFVKIHSHSALWIASNIFPAGSYPDISRSRTSCPAHPTFNAGHIALDRCCKCRSIKNQITDHTNITWSVPLAFHIPKRKRRCAPCSGVSVERMSSGCRGKYIANMVRMNRACVPYQTRLGQSLVSTHG